MDLKLNLNSVFIKASTDARRIFQSGRIADKNNNVYSRTLKLYDVDRINFALNDSFTFFVFALCRLVTIVIIGNDYNFTV